MLEQHTSNKERADPPLEEGIDTSGEMVVTIIRASGWDSGEASRGFGMLAKVIADLIRGEEASRQGALRRLARSEEDP